MRKGDVVVPRAQGKLSVDDIDWDIGDVIGSERTGRVLVKWRMAGAVYEEYASGLRVADATEIEAAERAGFYP